MDLMSFTDCSNLELKELLLTRDGFDTIPASYFNDLVCASALLAAEIKFEALKGNEASEQAVMCHSH